MSLKKTVQVERRLAQGFMIAGAILLIVAALGLYVFSELNEKIFCSFYSIFFQLRSADMCCQIMSGPRVNLFLSALEDL